MALSQAARLARAPLNETEHGDYDRQHRQKERNREGESCMPEL